MIRVGKFLTSEEKLAIRYSLKITIQYLEEREKENTFFDDFVLKKLKECKKVLKKIEDCYEIIFCMHYEDKKAKEHKK